MDMSMDIHEKSVDMDMDMDVIFHIHGNPENLRSLVICKAVHLVYANLVKNVHNYTNWSFQAV